MHAEAVELLVKLVEAFLEAADAGRADLVRVDRDGDLVALPVVAHVGRMGDRPHVAGVQGRELEAASEAKVVRVVDGRTVVTDGPYAETKEHLAGFFLVDVESRARAEEIAAIFAHPGDIIELRPAMWPGGPDA